MEEEHPNPQERRRRDESELDASWGGVNLSVKGSIVVLAMLTIAGTAINIWGISQQNAHFDGRVTNLETHLAHQDDLHVKHAEAMAEIRAMSLTSHTQLTDEIQRNRLYLREIQRVCMMNEKQRDFVQHSLSPTMRELLFRGESPLESQAQKERDR